MKYLLSILFISIASTAMAQRTISTLPAEYSTSQTVIVTDGQQATTYVKQSRIYPNGDRTVWLIRAHRSTVADQPPGWEGVISWNEYDRIHRRGSTNEYYNPTSSSLKDNRPIDTNSIPPEVIILKFKQSLQSYLYVNRHR